MFDRQKYNKLYHQKNKEIINARHKKYSREHKNEIKQQREPKKQQYLEYSKQYNKKYRIEHHADIDKYNQMLKEMMHFLKINGCAICGYDKCNAALDFHHVNPEDKKFNIVISRTTRSDLADELNKCILLCSNCHREIHNGGDVSKC